MHRDEFGVSHQRTLQCHLSETIIQLTLINLSGETIDLIGDIFEPREDELQTNSSSLHMVAIMVVDLEAAHAAAAD